MKGLFFDPSQAHLGQSTFQLQTWWKKLPSHQEKIQLCLVWLAKKNGAHAPTHTCKRWQRQLNNYPAHVNRFSQLPGHLAWKWGLGPECWGAQWQPCDALMAWLQSAEVMRMWVVMKLVDGNHEDNDDHSQMISHLLQSGITPVCSDSLNTFLSSLFVSKSIISFVSRTSWEGAGFVILKLIEHKLWTRQVTCSVCHTL